MVAIDWDGWVISDGTFLDLGGFIPFLLRIVEAFGMAFVTFVMLELGMMPGKG